MPWTSRRFCENCETEFRKEEWIPVVIPAVIAMLGGLFAFGSYLKTPEKPLSLTTNRIAANSADKFQDKAKMESVNVNSAQTDESISLVGVGKSSVQNRNSSSAQKIQAPQLQNEEDIPVYFCGAQTKKGTACSRKVKGGGRCWQHTGQASMLPKDKLIAGR